MALYQVVKYALYARTFWVTSDTPSEAVREAETKGLVVAEEFLSDAFDEDMLKTDFDTPEWNRLFDQFPGKPVEKIEALRTVTDRGTGERWDRWDGYWPPANVPGERKVGSRV